MEINLENELIKTKKELEKVLQIHAEDPDLNHALGADPDCMFCEKYFIFSSRIKLLEKKNQKSTGHSRMFGDVEEKVVKVRPRRTYSLYEILFDDFSEYLVYSYDPDAAARFLKKVAGRIKRARVIVPADYSSIYVELPNGSIGTVKQLIEEIDRKKNVLIAEKKESNYAYGGKCFNTIPLQYFVYSAKQLEKLKKFCGDVAITETKKFKTNGRISVTSKRGAFALEEGQVLLKIGESILIPMSRDEFNENFDEEESLMWVHEVR